MFVDGEHFQDFGLHRLILAEHSGQVQHFYETSQIIRLHKNGVFSVQKDQLLEAPFRAFRQLQLLDLLIRKLHFVLVFQLFIQQKLLSLLIQVTIRQVELVTLVVLLNDLLDLGLILDFADRVYDFVKLLGQIRPRFLRKTQHFTSELLVSVEPMSKNSVLVHFLVQLLLGPQKLLQTCTSYYLFVAEHL